MLMFWTELPLLPYFVHARSEGTGESEPSLIVDEINTKISCPILIFMPPTLKKLKVHIALGLSVRPNKNLARVNRFPIKINDPYFF